MARARARVSSSSRANSASRFQPPWIPRSSGARNSTRTWPSRGASRRQVASTAFATKPEAPVSSSVAPASRSPIVCGRSSLTGLGGHHTVSTDMSVESEPTSRQRILAVARTEFAERGFGGARLQDIARQAGLSHPTLLYHFDSKEALYGAVIESAVTDWAAETEAAVSTVLTGFEQVASIVEAVFRFFEGHEDFVRIVRREATEGGGRLEDAMVGSLRPFLDRAVGFLEREMRAGRLREHDPLELMQICYGATVLAALVTNRFAIFLRLGDGDILAVSEGEGVSRPIARA